MAKIFHTGGTFKGHIESSLRVLITILGLFACHLVQAEITKTTNFDSGLISWKFVKGGFELELIQRLPDQTRAFFLARGFSATVADDIARSCVFQAIGRNTFEISKGKSVSVNLHRWQIKSAGQFRPLKLKEQWDAQWPQAVVSPAARIAFRWATFPTEQTFEPVGDYNWGMISFALPPGSLFNLQVRWSVNGSEQQSWIQHLQCPSDTQ